MWHIREPFALPVVLCVALLAARCLAGDTVYVESAGLILFGPRLVGRPRPRVAIG